MKTRTLSMMLLASLLPLTLMACNTNNSQQPAIQEQAAVSPESQSQQVKGTAQQDLPAEITKFIQEKFPDATISLVEKDNEAGSPEFDITLNDGTEVDFDTNNQWESIDCKKKAVPAEFVPESIANYVKSKYQTEQIVKIDKLQSGYEIELSNRLDLNFDANGNFVSIDD